MADAIRSAGQGGSTSFAAWIGFAHGRPQPHSAHALSTPGMVRLLIVTVTAPRARSKRRSGGIRSLRARPRGSPRFQRAAQLLEAPSLSRSHKEAGRIGCGSNGRSQSAIPAWHWSQTAWPSGVSVSTATSCSQMPHTAILSPFAEARSPRDFRSRHNACRAERLSSATTISACAVADAGDLVGTFARRACFGAVFVLAM